MHRSRSSGGRRSPVRSWIQRVAGDRRPRADVAGVVRVSAMGDSTDELISLAHKSTRPPQAGRWTSSSDRRDDHRTPDGDGTGTAGGPGDLPDRVAGGIRTSSVHRSAPDRRHRPPAHVDELERGRVVVGGRCSRASTRRWTSRPRAGRDRHHGGALAMELSAERCEIYTDVAGVYTADPRVEPRARLIPEIAYQRCWSSRPSEPRSCIRAPSRSVRPTRCRSWCGSTFEDQPGTLICQHPAMEDRQKIRGIAHDSGVAKVILTRVPDRPGSPPPCSTPSARPASMWTSSSRT